MSLPAKRLGTSCSEGSLSVNSRLSDKRREKLISLKNREDLKDALTEKFKGRFGHGAHREADEVSVASSCIKREVDRFAQSAHVTEANLGRLERRIHGKATMKGADETSDMGVSAYSGRSGARSVASLAGQSIMKSGNGESFDWSRLDEYASFLHEQDALRQKMGVQALQRKLRCDLDNQVAEKKKKREYADQEDQRYHQNSMMELDRWKALEYTREEEKKGKLMREKQDRDDQLAFERRLKATEAERKQNEESSLVNKIVNEMEAEQKRFEKKKQQTKKNMRKVFEDNMEDQRRKNDIGRVQREKEAAAMKEYNRVLDEQEEQRAEELQQRVEKQNTLMKKLQANVQEIQQGAGDNDARRALAQAEEMDRHFAEAEAKKQERLKQLKVENQAYLHKQMQEKESKKEEERELQNIQAAILARDSEEYQEIEKQKEVEKRERSYEHREQIERQMAYKQRNFVPEMSEAEIQMNKPLLHLVNKTLQNRDQFHRSSPAMADEDED